MPSTTQAGTVGVVSALTERFPESNCLIVLGCRSRDGASHPAMREWLKRADVHHLDLPPLSRESAQELVADMAEGGTLPQDVS